VSAPKDTETETFRQTERILILVFRFGKIILSVTFFSSPSLRSFSRRKSHLTHWQFGTDCDIQL